MKRDLILLMEPAGALLALWGRSPPREESTDLVCTSEVGMLPQAQSGGIGGQMIPASLDYMRREPGWLIGLETIPDSVTSLSLYLNRSLRARMLKPIERLDPPLPGGLLLPRWSQVDGETCDRWLADLCEAKLRFGPGLNYSKETLLNARDRIGDVLLLIGEKRAVSVATVQLMDRHEGLRMDCYVNLSRGPG